MAKPRFNPNKDYIKSLAVKCNGNISQMAKDLNVERSTIYEYIKRDPHGKKVMDEARGLNTENDLDLAEHVIRYNLTNYKTNPGLAQRAAEKVIDKKGHLRRWADGTNTNPPNTSDLQGLITGLKDGIKSKASPKLPRSEQTL